MECGQHAKLLCSHFRRPCSRNRKCNLWHAVANCDSKNRCTIVYFTISDELIAKEDVPTNFTVIGSCQPMFTDVYLDKRNCRPLARDCRKVAVQPHPHQCTIQSYRRCSKPSVKQATRLHVRVPKYYDRPDMNYVSKDYPS